MHDTAVTRLARKSRDHSRDQIGRKVQHSFQTKVGSEDTMEVRRDSNDRNHEDPGSNACNILIDI